MSFSFFDAPEAEPIKKLYYLHDYTFPELIDVDVSVIDSTGVLWCGPARKNLNAPNPVDLWKCWQKNVQGAIGVKPEVMQYFQASKHFSRPPKKGEIDEVVTKLRVYKVPEKIVQNVRNIATTAAPRFTWSPSKIVQFHEVCPYQFAAQYYYKTVPYTETEATIWGTRVHKAAEDYMGGLEVTDEEAFQAVEKWAKLLGRIPGKRFVEHKIGVDKDFNTCDYDTAEGRMVLDFGVLKDDGELLLVDWKTGKQKDSDTQLRVYTLMMALQIPEATKISYKYIWLKSDTVSGGEVTRDELPALRDELTKKLDRMRQAWEMESFPKTRNGLCRNWCVVSECPNCGGGR